MKVAIIVAMEEELKPVLEKFASNDKKNFKKEKYFKNIFYKVKFKNIEIIIVKSGIGKINSTITATQVIEKFGVDKVFFSGVAGALKKDLKIGDIVLAEKIAQWDVDLTSFGYEKGKIPSQQKFIKSSKEMLDIASDILKNNFLKENKIKKGIIVSGDKFVDSIFEKEKIAKEFGADAVEMEGASLAFVCDFYKIDFLILRSISDELNENAVSDFNTFVEKSSEKVSQILFKIIEKMAK